MTALHTRTILDRLISQHATITTAAGPITGTINSIAYTDPDRNGDPDLVHIVNITGAEPGATVTIPWHAVICIGRSPEPDPTDAETTT